MAPWTQHNKKIVILAGEASGDALGGGLMAALKKTHPTLSFAGVGGQHMQAQGLESMAPMDNLGLIGITQIIRHLPTLLRARRQILDYLRTNAIDGLITIDMPGFSFWLGPKVKKLGIPHIHYVAPTVWAWKAKRAAKVAKFLDAILCLFPFEPSYFEKKGLLAPFVGHPVVQTYGNVPQPEKSALLKAFGLGADATVLLLLPGSRLSEINRHLPVFLQALRLYRQRQTIDAVFIPTLPHLAPIIAGALKEIDATGLPPLHIHTDSAERPTLFALAEKALAASGTVSLELACAGTPMVIAYKVSAFNAFLARRLLKISHVAMVNILMNKEIVPELLQENCTPEKLSAALCALPGDQKRDLKLIPRLLHPRGHKPAQAAARAIAQLWKL